MDKYRLELIKSRAKVSFSKLLVEDLHWLLNQVDQLQYRNERLENENEALCDKLADIRNLFDESDMKAEGHGMEDAIGSPYAVACYAENKLKRLIKENNELQEELNKWIAEFNF
jgi:hypothetical protein